MSSISASQSRSAAGSCAPASSCNIKGRLIPYQEFLPRLKNFCLSLGFKKSVVMIQESSLVLNAPDELDPAPLLAINDSVYTDDTEVVIILSTKVPYEPSWGVYSGLPRPLIHEMTDRQTEGTVSHFIAPYLVQYHYARNHMYLGCKKTGGYCITLPADLVDGSRSLQIHLNKIAKPDGEGHFYPLDTAESLVSFALSDRFVHFLNENNFSWEVGKMQRIGALLTAELFACKEIVQEKTPVGKKGNKTNFASSLLPQMNRIVTHANPQLRAAVIHQKYQFARLLDELVPTLVKKKSAKLLCVAGLDIDVAAFQGRGERYFVPWAAYRQLGARQDDAGRGQLQQDDLFVALMAQKKQCLVS